MSQDLIDRAAVVYSSMRDLDLRTGVVPISKAASSLAALIKRSRNVHQPIIVTQKGYPTGVLLDVELWSEIRDILGRIAGADEGEADEGEADEADADEAAVNGRNIRESTMARR